MFSKDQSLVFPSAMLLGLRRMGNFPVGVLLKCDIICSISTATDFIYGLSKIECLPRAHGCQSSEFGVIPIIDSNDGHEESIHGLSFRTPVI